MTRRLVVLVAVACIVFAACGGDDDEPARPLKESSPAPATPLPTTSETEVAPGADSAEAAAKGLYDAWLAGDDAGALAYATQDAVDDLFAQSASELQFMGCEHTGSKDTCFWYYEGGGLNLVVETDPGGGYGGYKVTKAFFVAD